MQVKQSHCDEKHTVLSITVSDLTEETPTIIRVCMTFTLLKSSISQDRTQTARQATYYAFLQQETMHLLSKTSTQ